MKWPDGKPYYSLNQYYIELFGQKTYKIALDIGTTCPNRDGTLDSRGCIFCSASGSGDYATKSEQSIDLQITKAITLTANKYKGDRYVAYLQSYTNTYGDYEDLKRIYTEIIEDPRICGLSIGTRPDCLDEDILNLLEQLATLKPVFVELGLQSIHAKTATFIRRCYPLSTFDNAVHSLDKRRIPVIVHLIAGLPCESNDEFLESVSYISTLPISGVKLQLLHILDDTDLGKKYLKSPFELLTLDTYTELIVKAISLLPPHIVIHRITGDGNKDMLIAPLWSLNKRKVLNSIHQSLASKQIWQGQMIPFK